MTDRTFRLKHRLSRAVVIALAGVAGVASLPNDSRAADIVFHELTLQPTQPTDPTTRRSAYSRSAETEIRFQEGQFLYNSGRLQQAEDAFQSVVASDPNDAQAYYFLGLAQLDQGEAEPAAANFDTSLRLDPSPDEVRAARARANTRLGRYDAANADIDAIQSNPQFTSLAHYLRGQNLYAQGDYRGAQREFAAAKRAGGTEAAPAEFYEGLTYIQMRDLVRAGATFRESAVLDANRDPTLVAASRQLDAVLSLQQRPSKPWEATINLGYEWDSNVIEIGSNIPTPDGISDQEDSRIVLQPSGSYSFIQQERLEIGIEANGYFTWQFELSDFDVASYQAGPFINYRLVENLYLSARYGYNYVELGHEWFLRRHVITPQVTWVQKNFGYTSGYYQFQDREFGDTDDTTPALNRDGPIHTLGIVQGINLPRLFPESGPAALEVSYRLDIQDTDGSDFEGLLHNVGLTLYTPLPFWKLRGDVGVSLGFDRYDNPNSLDDADRRREDFEWTVSTGLTREVTKNVSLRVDYSYTDHDSNIETGGTEPFSFDRHQVGVRMIWSL